MSQYTKEEIEMLEFALDGRYKIKNHVRRSNDIDSVIATYTDGKDYLLLVNFNAEILEKTEVKCFS